MDDKEKDEVNDYLGYKFGDSLPYYLIVVDHTKRKTNVFTNVCDEHEKELLAHTLNLLNDRGRKASDE